MKRTVFDLTLLCSILAGLVLAGCTDRSREPNIELIQDMMVTPAVKAQDEDPNSMKLPPEHTVAKGVEAYPYLTAEEAGAKLKNPMTYDQINILEGQKLFMTYCSVCHGVQGDGKGPVAAVWPAAIPNMRTQRVRDFPDGHIFHIITKGRGLMGSYAYQVHPESRWKIIVYLRHLQKNSSVLPDTVKANN